MKKIIERLNSPEPVRIVFAGDSITHGALHTYGSRDYTELFSERLRYEMNRPRDIVIKTGISGWTTQAVRDDIEWNVLQFRPHIVSIMLGMNDAAKGREAIGKFKDNYNFIIDEIEKLNSLVLLHTMNPIWESAKKDRGDLPFYVEAVREIASQRKLPVIDHYSYWQQKLAEDPRRSFGWMDDEIHPNSRGHCIFARMIFKNLKMWDMNKSKVCRQIGN